MSSYLDRYRGGECEVVWAELLALGEAVQDEPVRSDAWAVALETMTRARHNVALLVERLGQIGYQFAFPEAVWRPPDTAPPYQHYLAPDAIHKSDVSGGEGMSILLPNSAADAVPDGSDWQDVPFVSYLRICFRWGGFPGLGHWFSWSTYRPDPGEARAESTLLVTDLLPI